MVLSGDEDSFQVDRVSRVEELLAHIIVEPLVVTLESKQNISTLLGELL